ncbi:MAG: hypothetical protein ACKOVB_07110 [Terrabacter sp.]
MTPTTTLVFGAVAILVVVAWFVFGVIDGTRPEPTEPTEKLGPTAPAEDEASTRREHATTTR